MPTVSVIIPTFNRAYCLERALLSVINQTHPITEIIIVDDGSNDRTEQILDPYKNQITLIKQDNHGVSHARNTGIKRAHCEWIALLDSDDAWQTNKLEQQFSQLSQQERLISHTDEIWIRNNRRVNPKKIHQKQGGWIFENCLPLCAISPSSVVIHKKVFQQVGLFDESLPACEDYDLWLRITSQFPVDFAEQPLTIKYGGHEDQLSKKHWGMDRFRIQALQKIIDSNTLSTPQHEAAVAILLKKAHIYLNGAQKRDKHCDIKHYSKIINRFS